MWKRRRRGFQSLTWVERLSDRVEFAGDAGDGWFQSLTWVERLSDVESGAFAPVHVEFQSLTWVERLSDKRHQPPLAIVNVSIPHLG